MTMAPKSAFKFTSSIARLKLDSAATTNHLRIVSNAIDTIYERSSSQLSFNEIYTTVYNLVLEKRGDVLYERLQETCQVHLARSVSRILTAAPTNFLATVVQEWNDHKTAFESITRVVMYMDRTYCTQKKKNDSLTLLLSLFRDKVVHHSEIRDTLRQHLLNNILQERRGNVIDRSLLRECLLMLVQVSVQCTVSVYESDFEVYFLAETEQFYRTESLDYLSTNSCAEYMSKITRRFAEESERLSNYLAMETEPKLRNILEQRLLVEHIRALIDMEQNGILALYRAYQPCRVVTSQTTTAITGASSKAIQQFLQDTNNSNTINSNSNNSNNNLFIIEELKRFFLLFARVPACFEIIRDTLAQEIVRRGQDILSSQETTRDPVVFVKELLYLKDQFDEIIVFAYRHDKRLEKKAKDAIQTFVNRDNRTAAHLSAYLDDFFRKGMQGLSEHDINVQFDKVIVLFHFLSDKDVFEEYYKNALCKRLLNAKSASDDNEKLMISKLKAECGYQYTTKLEGMFVDMNTSKQVMDVYRASAYPAMLAPLEMDVQVLTTGFWPLQPSAHCHLTREIQSMIQHFTNFYTQQYSGRKLTWFPSMSNNDVRANYPLGKKDLNVTTFQWCILQLFNLQDTWSYEAIKDALKLPELELKRHLLSLCTPKLRILNKASRGKGIEHDDVISFNAEFSFKLKRLKVPLISLKEIQALSTTTSNTNSNTSANNGTNNSHSNSTVVSDEMGITAEGIPLAVEENRRHQVEAAIVRIMKARKTLVHNELIAETTKQLAHLFVPSAQFIKKRIESLIEREFLQRDAEDTRLYNYLA